ncbi:MAG: crotonase/enoyl-CoA hydratase family protein [Thermodesulfobacteriota bacterium]|nr:crotonase/enoyl-CoA hydratase family protein [Thermodesulfobacteriota bacterium]
MAFIRGNTYQQLITKFEPEYGIMWYSMDPKPRPCFTIELLHSVRKVQRLIEQMNMREREANGECPIRYGVLASKSAGVYSYGGDMKLFQDLILEKNGDALRDYAVACVDCVFSNYTLSLATPVTIIGLVQGDALGGGFEAALSCNVIIAEEAARFGFPEVLFNLFPGMGAYSLLSRRLDARRAEQIILSGNTYSAAQLHEWGIVDVLAKNGEGENALYAYVDRHFRKRNAYQAFHKVRQTYNPISYEELMEVALIWVQTALHLRPKDLRLMERLVKAQEKISNGSLVAGLGGGDYA